MCDAIDQSGSSAGRLEGPEPAIVGAGAHILIIDDDPHFLRVLKRLLSAEKFSVVTTTDSCEALELLTSGSFNLLICDLRMPDCDGLNVLQSIRSKGSEIPVIILTAYGEVDSYLDAMNAGATEYLNKPIKSDELVHVVRHCLCRGNHGRNSKPPNIT